MQSLAERLERQIAHEPNTGCWLWTGTALRQGYGRIRVDGKEQFTHRLAWELARGPIPEGLCVCHHCDTPPCINPTHLFLGTKADNMRDRYAKGRYGQSAGVRHYRSRLTEADILAIRGYEGWPYHIIAAHHGISESHVAMIRTRRRWASVPEGPFPGTD